MSNVHTLRDLPPVDPFPGGGQRAQTTRQGSLFNQSYDPQGERPRCIEIVFPGFNPKTFIFLVSLIQIAVFAASCIIGSYGLTPSEYSLDRLGASYGPPIVRNFQVWRFITPLFLHGSFWHILFNIFFQLRMGFTLENQYGTKLMVMFYFVCGICGNLFSLALAPCKIAVGASTAGFGLIGLQMANVALTWHLLQRKQEVIFNITFFIMMSIMISIGPHSVVDWRGHFGGFLGGFALGVIYADSTGASRPIWYKTGKSVAGVGLAALIITCVGILFGIPLDKRGC